MTQMWSSSGKVINGMPNIDCRYNYTNHFDVFADVVGIYRSNIYYEQKGNPEVAGTISAYWNDRKTATEEDIIKQNNLYANVIASAERAWMGGGKQYIEVSGTMLPNSGEEFDEFAAAYVNRFYGTVVTPKAGAKELLSALRERGVRICLASATDRRYLSVALESCGLAEFFTPETILSCSDIGVGKERPDVFLAAAKVMGTPLSETAVFEDSALALETAKGAGFITVGVYDAHQLSQERLRASSDVYLDEGKTLADALSFVGAES